MSQRALNPERVLLLKTLTKVKDSEHVSWDPYAVLGLPKGADGAAVKKAYRKLAKENHPDKGGDSDKFKKANEANRNKDLGALMEMADELGVEVPMDNDMRNQLTKHISAVSDTITNLKTTMAWTWCHVDNDNKDTLKQYILQQLNVS